MATVLSATPTVKHGTRFLITGKNNLDNKNKCTFKSSNASCHPRFTVLTNPLDPSMHFSPSFCSRFLLPSLPFCSLFKPCLPHFRPSFLPFMSSKASSQPPPSSSPTKTERVVIKGRVQGVCYRDWTVENATQLGLKGWVRNRRDGSVEALFSGNPDAVQEMEQRCRRGPPAAMVTGLQVFPSDDDPGTAFECKLTV